jgi:hypothetical protein
VVEKVKGLQIKADGTITARDQFRFATGVSTDGLLTLYIHGQTHLKIQVNSVLIEKYMTNSKISVDNSKNIYEDGILRQDFSELSKSAALEPRLYRFVVKSISLKSASELVFVSDGIFAPASSNPTHGIKISVLGLSKFCATVMMHKAHVAVGHMSVFNGKTRIGDTNKVAKAEFNILTVEGTHDAGATPVIKGVLVKQGLIIELPPRVSFDKSKISCMPRVSVTRTARPTGIEIEFLEVAPRNDAMIFSQSMLPSSSSSSLASQSYRPIFPFMSLISHILAINQREYRDPIDDVLAMSFNESTRPSAAPMPVKEGTFELTAEAKQEVEKKFEMPEIPFYRLDKSNICAICQVEQANVVVSCCNVNVYCFECSRTVQYKLQQDHKPIRCVGGHDTTVDTQFSKMKDDPAPSTQST